MNSCLDNFKKLQTRATKGKKGATNADFRLFFTLITFFGPFLLILNQTKNSKFKNNFFEKYTSAKFSICKQAEIRGNIILAKF